MGGAVWGDKERNPSALEVEAATTEARMVFLELNGGSLRVGSGGGGFPPPPARSGVGVNTCSPRPQRGRPTGNGPQWFLKTLKLRPQARSSTVSARCLFSDG